VEWWQRIFNTPLYFELYEKQDTELAKTQVSQLVKLLELTPPARVLDVACGYGRHSVELARRGFQVTGLDLSDVQLGRARETAAAAGVAPEFVLGDSRAMPFEAEFDAAINMFLSFGYFQTDEEHLALLRGVARALRPGGRFLMDFWNREREIRGFERWLVERTGEVFEVEEWEFDHLNGRLDWTNYVFFADGRRESWKHSIRAYTIVELRQLFERAGLRMDAVYGSLDGQPFTIDSPAAVLVATRP
jgi:SAM-dependent methyltransferase